MFLMSDAAADAIRAAFDERGEFAAVCELRRRFHGIIDDDQARACALTIAGWRPLPSLGGRKPAPGRPDPEVVRGQIAVLYREGLPYKEIAGRIDRPLGTVHAATRRLANGVVPRRQRSYRFPL